MAQAPGLQRGQGGTHPRTRAGHAPGRGFLFAPGRTAIPYANEHACRVRSPDDFQEGSFRRIRREADGKDLFLIVGRLKGETTTTLQAFRYPRTQWTEGQARRHCRDHEGQGFEPATGEETMEGFDFAEFEKRLRETELVALADYKAGKADAPLLYRADGSIKPPADNQPMVFVASQESEDRFGDVILAAGWELDNFKKNPVFMFCHDHSLAPIGTFPRVWVDDKKLLAQPKWDDEDDFARFIHGKYDRGVMRGISVGFRAIEFADREKKGVEFKRQELLELSAVPIPAHPAALRKAMGERKFSIVVPSLVSVAEEPCCDELSMKGVIGWGSAHPEGTPEAAPLRAFGEEDEAAEEERERKENLLTEVGEILAGLKSQLTHEKEEKK